MEIKGVAQKKYLDFWMGSYIYKVNYYEYKCGIAN